MAPEEFKLPEENNKPKNEQQESEKKYIPQNEGVVANFNKECKEKRGVEFTDENKKNFTILLSNGTNKDDIYPIIDDIIDNTDDVNVALEEYLTKVLGKQEKNTEKQTQTTKEQAQDGKEQAQDGKEQAQDGKEQAQDGKEQAENIRKGELQNRSKNFDEFVGSVKGLDFQGKDYGWVIEDINALKILSKSEAGKGYTENVDEKVQELLAKLKNSPEILGAIYLDLQKEDPKQAENFRTSLISLDLDFKPIMDGIEAKSKIALGSETLKGATIKGKMIEQTDRDGYTTTANLDGSRKTIGLADSKFKLESNDEYKELTREAMEESARIETRLRAETKPIYESLQNFDAIKTYLETKTSEDSIEDIKTDIKTFSPKVYADLGIENMTSLAEIKAVVDSNIEKSTKEKDEIEKKAGRELDELVKNHAEKTKKKEELYKEYLTLHRQTGIDNYTNDEISRMFSSVNTNPQSYGLQKPIDLNNLSLGFDKDFGNEKISYLEKEGWFELCNRTCTGKPFFPIGYENGNIVYYASEEDAKNKIPASATFNINKFVRTSLGVDPVRTAQKNLSDSLKNYGPIGSKKISKN